MANWFTRLFSGRRASEPVAAAKTGGVQTTPTPENVGHVAFHREPAIQLFTTYSQVSDVQSVVQAHDFGYFQLSSFLIEQILQNPRVRGIVGTREAGLVGTAIRWEPSKQNDAARRAARAIEEDWPLIISTPTRKQLHEWGLLLGVGFAQKHWYQSRTTGRAIPRVEVYHPSWTAWNWGPRLYQVWTQEGIQWVPSPSLLLPGQRWPALTPDIAASGQRAASPWQWVVHEPFGQHSWRRGLLHAVWSPWLAHEWARRDMARAAEKLGLAGIKVKYPKVSKEEPSLKAFLLALQNLNSEGIIPLEQREDGLNYDAEVFEYGGVGYDIIHRTKDSNAIDLAVLLLGHNLTTEIKGGSYAAANIGDLIRGDIKAEDAAAEWSTMDQQVIGDWAEVNFGDRELAPRAVYETDPPALNMTAAQTLSFVAQAITTLSKVAPWIDYEALCTRFRIPMVPGQEHTIAPPPPPPPQAPPKKLNGDDVDAMLKNIPRAELSWFYLVANEFERVKPDKRAEALQLLDEWVQKVRPAA